MDHETAHQIIKDCLQYYARLFAVNHWTVHVTYDPIDQDEVDNQGHMRATCLRKVSYDLAIINVDVARFDTAEELRNAIRHEVMHIVHAPFDLFYETIMWYVPNNKHTIEAMQRIYAHACEQMVKTLENAFDWNNLHAAGEECTHVKKVEPATEKHTPVEQLPDPTEPRTWAVTVDFISVDTGARTPARIFVKSQTKKDACHQARSRALIEFSLYPDSLNIVNAVLVEPQNAIP